MTKLTEAEFAEVVIMKLREDSMMTYTLRKKEYRNLKRFFLRKAKKHLNWDKTHRRYEFDRFCTAFNIKITNGK